RSSRGTPRRRTEIPDPTAAGNGTAPGGPGAVVTLTCLAADRVTRRTRIMSPEEARPARARSKAERGGHERDVGEGFGTPSVDDPADCTPSVRLDWLTANDLADLGLGADVLSRLPTHHTGSGGVPVWHRDELVDLIALAGGGR